MINRLKSWNIKNINIGQNQIIQLSLFLSIFAVILSIPGGTECASANQCQIGSTATFTNDISIMSGTNYNLTQAHNYSQNVIANWQDVGGNHTGTVIMQDNAGDFNLNGGLRLGTSATSTNGTIRWNGSNVQVYNTGWSNIGATPTDDIGQVTADSGSFTASSQQDNINIVGGSGVTTSITSDTLTINASASAPTCSYYAYASASASVNTSEGVRIDTEYYDPDNCFTLFGSPGSLYGITYNGTPTLVFDVNALVNFGNGASRSMFKFVVNNTQTFSYQMADGQTGSQLGHSPSGVICLNQNDTLSIQFGNTTSNDVEGGFNYSLLTLNQNIGVQSYATSQTCTNGLIN
tara:strand:+ start:10034 stop:11080 length:1047 start_codon:yes stop_codon:yes gene_type:complete